MEPHDLAAIVDAYFDAERMELLALAGYGAVLATVGHFLFRKRTIFAKSFALMLLLAAIISLAVSVPLLVRDTTARQQLQGELNGPGAEDAVIVEVTRMSRVLGRYPLYRYFYAASILVAVGLVVFARGSRSNAVAAGLVLIAVSGLVVDQFSERRALHYHRQLANWLEATR